MKEKVIWEKCAYDNWAHLKTLDLTSPSLVENGQCNTGVYIIWSETEKRVVRVGSGRIAERLEEHSQNPLICKHPELLVTFAIIKDKEVMLGVEAYLAAVYSPVIGDRFPDATHIYVNLPKIDVYIAEEYLASRIID
ncbi:hypothetical protein [uncultured Bacteroides sp.]|uniref:hypothetical protein n=1 Tax=uncultured Bacteroides sp. TaxID=162156 RepID=UPI0025EBB18B|nr:hypothetical protein [uncultured Bacteroides sp.]